MTSNFMDDGGDGVAPHHVDGWSRMLGYANRQWLLVRCGRYIRKLL